MELHKYNKDIGESVRIGKRQVISPSPYFFHVPQCLYPPPPNHSSQCINFSWYDTLRNISDLCSTEEVPPPLYFDDLRFWLADGVKSLLSLQRIADNPQYLIAEMKRGQLDAICSYSCSLLNIKYLREDS